MERVTAPLTNWIGSQLSALQHKGVAACSYYVLEIDNCYVLCICGVKQENIDHKPLRCLAAV